MYADLSYHVVPISKFLIAILFLYQLLPSMMIGRIEEDKADNLVAIYIRSVFFTISIGYLLAVTKLFEFLTIAIIIIALFYRRNRLETKYTGKSMKEGAGLFILQFLDEHINVWKAVTVKAKNIKNMFSKTSILLHFSMEKTVFAILTLTVLMLSAYIRFHDAMVHAAVPLSDSYITLDWLKSVERRRLFYEPGGGVYPRGLSIFMATIHKFSFIDELFVLKYTGPFNGLLIVISILYVVYKLTKSKYTALVVTALYGLGAGNLGSDIVRQAATNSQEFALVFFLPTIYFTYKYLRERRQRDFLTAIAGLTVMGLAHTFVYFFAVIAVSINIFILFVKGPMINFRHYMKLIAGGVFSAVVAMIPFAVGLLEGVGLHGSSVEFLTKTGNIILKKLSVFDYLAMFALVLFGVSLLIMAKKIKDAYALVPVFIYCICVFSIYFAGGYITKSTLLDTRTKEIWAVCAALSIGVGFGLFMSRMELREVGRICSLGMCMISIGLVIHDNGVKALEPYKMEWDSGVEQYLKITKEYSPKSWIMVAEELQYAMVTGTGFLITTDNFTRNYSPEVPYTGNWLKIGEHIFIYQQKNIFKVEETNSIYNFEKPLYDKMEITGKAMDRWLETYRASGGEYSIYYEDENIRFVYINNKAYKVKDKEKLWRG